MTRPDQGRGGRFVLFASCVSPFWGSWSKGEKNVAQILLTLAGKRWQRSAKGPYSLQPRLAQGRKHALHFRWVFVGEQQFEDLQRDKGKESMEFGYFSAGFLFSASFAVEDRQFHVGV